MHYYTAPGGKLKGTIDLTNAVVYIDEHCKKQPAFAIKTDERTFFIHVESVDETQTWVARLMHQIKVTHRHVSFSDFSILKLLGRGAYGKVFLVEHKGTGQIFAMKSLSKSKLAQYDLAGRTIAERNVLIQANHPFLVGAAYAFQTDTKVFLIMDYVPGGELFKRMADEKTFSIDRVRLYVAELVLAIEYLHSLGVVHRDLKPENILVDVDGHLRITDFGLVKEKMSDGQTTSTFCGTPEYIAPEIISAKPYTVAVDWWALGILTYQMLYGKVPFFCPDNAMRMFRMICEDPVPFPESPNYPHATDFVRGLCEKNPANRLGVRGGGVREIKEHPFLAEIDWAKLFEKAIDMPWKPEIVNEMDVRAFGNFGTEEPIMTIDVPEDVPDGVNNMLRDFDLVNPLADDTI
jgi:serine/threonine protein kinase